MECCRPARRRHRSRFQQPDERDPVARRFGSRRFGRQRIVSESSAAIRGSRTESRRLTRRLLAFSHKQERKPELLDLNSVLAGCEKLVRPLIGEDIELVFRPGAQVGSVEVDPGQIYQIIMNLAVNSRDAMPQGGTLTIETTPSELNEAEGVILPEAKPGAYAMLRVSNTGVGMDTGNTGSSV